MAQHAQPLVPGVPVRGPRYAPPPNSVLIGYHMVQPRPGCCQLDGFTTEGWIAVIVLLICFWPLFWIPCLMDSCYAAYQEPVFGYPDGQQPPPMQPAGSGHVAQGMPVAMAQYPMNPAPTQPAGAYPPIHKGSEPAGGVNPV